ncbi:MAG: DNA-directed RNA polymerase, subunit E'' [Candidatus Diapherotrites archaeon]|nr:DNA-directed RNA polymerase, subunit E'' [Candidatus Diapherotrites archaeon]
MIKEKACRNCRTIIEEANVKECPECGSKSLTTFWRGYVVIINPEKSEIAKKMGITKPGKYALQLSR